MIDKGTITKHLPQKLDIDGGTMKGAIFGITSTAEYNSLSLKTNIPKGENPSSSEFFHALGLVDSSGSSADTKRLSEIFFGRLNTGATRAGFRVYKNNTRDTTNATLEVRCNSDNTKMFACDGKSIELVEASGTNYIRYASGVQICWGYTSMTNGTRVNYPVAFTSNPSVFINKNSGATTTITSPVIDATASKEYFIPYVTPGGAWFWLAIGKWK